MSGARTAILVGTGAFVCILHASLARSEELCAAADAHPATLAVAAPATCPADMVEVEGDYCPDVEQTCLRRPEKLSYRCLEYAPSRCTSKATQKKHFCMDTYEWPNKKGEQPVVMRTWYEARDACKAAGKRLCTQEEWTLACEGPKLLPYPYGQSRDATACNIDKDHPYVDEKALSDPAKRDAEVARLWQGEPSGSRDRCVSPFGVHDMTGNVDEWTLNESGKPHYSALKGGYWSWVRGRCRAVTPGHEESFRYYQIGFRCCSDAGESGEPSAIASAAATAPAPAPAPAPARVAAPDPPKGTIVLPPSGDGHRVFLDGKVVGPWRATLVVECGPHVVKLGHDGRDQPIDVPCGGRAAASYP